MSSKIGFFTGARSEYGIMKNLIKEVNDSESFSYSLYVSGMHLLDTFGNTIDEIKQDGFHIDGIIKAFTEKNEPNAGEFSKIITGFSSQLEKDEPDILFVIGDRPETYAAVLGAHFAGVPVIHAGGGTITKGAVDNKYRYNITNLSDYYFATSKGNYERLRTLPTLEDKQVYFTGSFAIDAIQKFKSFPCRINDYVSTLNPNNFCLMTFHPVTESNEPIAEIMDEAINYIIHRGVDILLTYPNNDPGFREIISVIMKWENNEHVFVKNHLGAQGYYASLNECKFVIGNSSSGIIEAPYFEKQVIDIGSRQEGREKDKGVTTIATDNDEVLSILEMKFSEGWQNVQCNNIYGEGNSLKKIMKLLENVILA